MQFRFGKTLVWSFTFRSGEWIDGIICASAIPLPVGLMGPTIIILKSWTDTPPRHHYWSFTPTRKHSPLSPPPRVSPPLLLQGNSLSLSNSLWENPIKIKINLFFNSLLLNRDCLIYVMFLNWSMYGLKQLPTSWELKFFASQTNLSHIHVHLTCVSSMEKIKKRGLEMRVVVVVDNYPKWKLPEEIHLPEGNGPTSF